MKPPQTNMSMMRMGNTKDIRSPSDGMRNQGQSSLVDALGAEQTRQKKIAEIRQKYGLPSPQYKLAPKNPVQWMGDNRG